MVLKKQSKVVNDKVKPHTVKKFELIEAYVEAWAPKLLNCSKCNGIVFIDCMCNSGVYHDDSWNEIHGTPIRVAHYLSKIMANYPKKQARLYFNDFSSEKIEILKTHLPPNTSNFNIITQSGDGNKMLKLIKMESQIHYLLVYDPYQASIDWAALQPFLCGWSEVIINHMVSDTIRGISQAKGSAAEKYEQTYLTSIKDLVTFGNDRSAYEKRIQKIIATLRGRQCFIASFPFFNTKNGLVYNILHCGCNIEGFKLFKKTAWNTFGGKSSSKDTHGMERQTELDFNGSGKVKTMTDEYCYYVKDIVDYIHNKFRGRSDVPISDIWDALDEHPVFPSDGYKSKIKKELKDIYNDIISKQTITFKN